MTAELIGNVDKDALIIHTSPIRVERFTRADSIAAYARLAGVVGRAYHVALRRRLTGAERDDVGVIL